MVNQPPILKIENAGFSHGETRIFKDVAFEVHAGETFCLLGPNGCGKTTILDCLLGINTLNRGEIFINSRKITSMPPARLAREVAYVPQTHSRSFSFTVMDILLMGRTPYTAFYSAPGTEDLDRARSLLASLDLLHLENRDYTRLSGGENQLVMILRALVQDSRIIIMDEPTAHLDFKNELMVLEIITRLIRDKGITLVMATHFPNHAFYLENAGLTVQVGFMDREKIHPAGPPSQALTRENLKRFYRVDTAVVSHTPSGKPSLKQIIPLHTLENTPLGKTP